LHPYLTDRTLAGNGALQSSRTIAGRHHERLDGSGYPHGLTAASLTPADRLLAAARLTRRLTDREARILTLVARDLSNREIAVGPGAEDGLEPYRAHLHQARRQQSGRATVFATRHELVGTYEAP
jgi:hypothetical protein